MPNMAICPACGNPKPTRWNLCKECLEIYGGTIAEWPLWLLWSVNDLKRWEYDNVQVSENEISLDALDPEWFDSDQAEDNCDEPGLGDAVPSQRFWDRVVSDRRKAARAVAQYEARMQPIAASC